MKRRSVERYGDIPETPEQLKADSHFYTTAGDGSPLAGKTLDDLDMTDDAWRNPVLKAIDDESIRQGTPHGYVALSACLDRLRRYLPGGGELTNANQLWRTVLQPMPDAYLNERTQDDERQVQAADTGYMSVGDSPTAGGKDHKAVMEEAYVPLTQLGFLVDILDQEADSMPDAMATLDDQLYLDGIDDPGVIAERVNNYRENHPELFRLAGVHDAYIEAEHSTGETQPSQTIVNLAAAHNAEQRCLFLCRPDAAEAVYTSLTDGAACCHSDHNVDGERRFYTATNEALSIDGEKMTRPGPPNGENIWVHDQQTGQYILRDTAGTEHARFDTAADIYTDASQYPAGGPHNIKPPVIPEFEFDGGDPTAAAWDIIVVPEAERDADGDKQLHTPLDLCLYQHDDENIPLCDLPETDAASDASPASVATGGRDDPEPERQEQGNTAEAYDRAAAVDDFAAHYTS